MDDVTTDDRLMPLVAAARDGDTAALGELFDRVGPGLRAYLRLNVGARLRNAESCSDLVQSVFREVVGDLHAFRGDSSAQFRGWLHTIALHKIHERRRYHEAQRRDVRRVARPDDSRLLDVYASVSTPSRHAAVHEELERVEAAFERLPEDYRRVLSLYCVTGLCHRDVAAKLGRREDAVRKLLSRARARLALEMAAEPG